MKSNKHVKHLVSKFKDDTDFRIKTVLEFSFIINLLYSVFLLIASQIYDSRWFFVTSIYYALLSLMRIFMFYKIVPEQLNCKKLVTIRNCGYFLFLLNLVVSIMSFILIFSDTPIKYHEIVVITLATYTFSSLTVAILSSIKHIKNNDYGYAIIKTISLISASVSMVTLTNTMLTTFGKENLLLRSYVLPLVSVAVSVLIVASAVYMVKKANKEIRILKNEQIRK